MNTIATIASLKSDYPQPDLTASTAPGSFAALLSLQINEQSELANTFKTDKPDTAAETPPTDPGSIIAALLQQMAQPGSNIAPVNAAKEESITDGVTIDATTAPPSATSATSTTPAITPAIINIADTTWASTVAAATQTTISDKQNTRATAEALPAADLKPIDLATLTTNANSSEPQLAFLSQKDLQQASLQADSKDSTLNMLSAAETPAPSNAPIAPPISTPTAAGSSNTPAFVATVTTPIQSPEWRDHFAQQISWFSTQGTQVAELQLNPAELGPVNIKIEITDNQATATFSSAHSEVRTAIENALPKLRESLAENGISLGQANINDQAPKERGNERLNRGTQREFTQENIDILAATEATPVRRQLGLLDTFA